MSLINEQQVVLDLMGADRHEATRTLAERLVASGRCTDLDTFLGDVRKREETMATGLPGGIGIPHARSEAITEPSLVFGRVADGIDWGAKDGPANLVFLIAAPASGGEAHMQMLPKLARALMKKEFKAALLAATNEAEVVDIVSREVALDPAAETSPAATSAAAATRATSAAAPAAATGSDAGAVAPKRVLKLVGVTSCPTGIAHTYMAAEGLERAAKAAGHEILVETQGSAGSKPLTAAQIAEADGVIFAHDLPVKDVGRFAGKPTVDVGVKKGISDGPQLVTEIENLVDEWSKDPSKAAAAAAAGAGAAAGGGGMSTKVDTQASVGTRIRQVLMTGVSYMIPFVAAGGILIALGFMVAQFAGGKQGAIDVTAQYTLNPGSTAEGVTILQNSFDPLNGMHWAALLFLIGAAAFGFLVPDPLGLHRLRDRRPARPRARHRRRIGRRHHGHRLPRGSGHRLPRRLPRQVGRELEGAQERPRCHAGRRHPDGVHADHDRPVHHRHRPSDQGSVRCPRLRPQWHGWLERHRPWPHPRRHDGLRPRRSGQQGRLRLRDDRSGRRRHGH